MYLRFFVFADEQIKCGTCSRAVSNEVIFIQTGARDNYLACIATQCEVCFGKSGDAKTPALALCKAIEQLTDKENNGS